MKKNKKLFVTLLCVFSLLFVGTLSMRCVKVQSTPPISVSKGECVMEVDSRRVLYANGADVRLPMASTTKIVTCLTVLELCNNLEETVTIPQEAVGIEGSSVYLRPGDIYTVKDLLYGLMLRSGNDCAVALALHCQGSVARFCAKMNEFAEKAGAFSSRFQNPHGLPCQQHYTTAFDLALISCMAMQNPIFCEIVATKYYSPKNWANKNKMLYNFDGATGIKTGFTKEAGRCLVSSATRNGMKLVCVVLNSPMMYERSTELLDGAFSTYTMRTLIKKGERFEIDKKIGVSQKEYAYPLSDGENAHIKKTIKPIKDKNNNGIIGEFEIYLTKRLIFSGNLYKL